MSGAHSRIAPSSAYQWVECTGSVVMQERYPQNEESEDSRIGTASHWVGASLLEAHKAGAPIDPGQFLGTTAPNGVIITEEMIDGAVLYVDDVIEVCSKNDMLKFLNIEESVKCPRVHAESWGTPDSWVYDYQAVVLPVWDYKFGHRAVNPFDNWQLINYVTGIIEALFTDKNEPEIIIDFRIIQPRSYHHEGPIRSWRVEPKMLRAHINRLQSAAIEALGDNPETKSGPWCHDCSARHVCRTAQGAGYNAVDIIGGLAADELPPEALGLEISILERAAKAAEDRLEGLKAHALEVIRSGKHVPGYGVAQGKGREKWAKPVAEVFALGKLYQVDLSKPLEAITPKQAIKAGIDAAVIKAYSMTPQTGLKLVVDDGTQAKRIFSQP